MDTLSSPVHSDVRLSQSGSIATSSSKYKSLQKLSNALVCYRPRTPFSLLNAPRRRLCLDMLKTLSQTHGTDGLFPEDGVFFDDSFSGDSA